MDTLPIIHPTTVLGPEWDMDAVCRIVRRELRRADASTPLGRRIIRIRAALPEMSLGPALEAAIAAELTAARPKGAQRRPAGSHDQPADRPDFPLV